MAKVLLGMSGGVDSSVALALLLDQGHDVTGMTLRMLPRGVLYDHEDSCCSITSVMDAKILADTMGIRHYQRNVSESFESLIIDDFVESYAKGETPNPCVRCNRYIKFGDLFEQMDLMGFDYLATGHYAGLRKDDLGKIRLTKPKDLKKDQTYFLYSIQPAYLDRILFPLQDLTKDEVREIAHAKGLEVASKKDSEDICFVKSGQHASFIEQRNPELIAPGKFINEAGQEIGDHPGIVHFTEGQRKGLGIALGERAYVTSINSVDKTVRLGSDRSLYKHYLHLKDCNWLIDPLPTEGDDCDVKVRHTPFTTSSTILKLGREEALIFAPEGIRAPALGQSAVCYLGDDVLGGGVISQTWNLEDWEAADIHVDTLLS